MTAGNFYALRALALAHPDNATVVSDEDAWQRAKLPARFAEFIYPNGRIYGPRNRGRRED